MDTIDISQNIQDFKQVFENENRIIFSVSLSKSCDNCCERMIYHLAMERRNWLHNDSHLGAENIAFMFSLVESCKLNDINFCDYIEDIITRLMEGEQDFMSLILCNYNSNKKMNVKAA